LGLARLRRVATGRTVLLAASVFVAFSVVFFNSGPVPAAADAADAPLLDNRFAWTREDAQSFLSALGAEGRGLYGLVLTLDAVYALTFAAAGALLLVWISARTLFPTNPLRLVALIPVLAGALDLLENAGIAILLSTFPPVPPSLAAMLGLVTAAKLVLVNLSFALAVLGLAGVFALSVSRRGRGVVR
jgi:hypothetical protein